MAEYRFENLQDPKAELDRVLAGANGPVLADFVRAELSTLLKLDRDRLAADSQPIMDRVNFYIEKLREGDSLAAKEQAAKPILELVTNLAKTMGCVDEARSVMPHIEKVGLTSEAFYSLRSSVAPLVVGMYLEKHTQPSDYARAAHSLMSGPGDRRMLPESVVRQLENGLKLEDVEVVQVVHRCLNQLANPLSKGALVSLASSFDRVGKTDKRDFLRTFNRAVQEHPEEVAEQALVVINSALKESTLQVEALQLIIKLGPRIASHAKELSLTLVAILEDEDRTHYVKQLAFTGINLLSGERFDSKRIYDLAIKLLSDDNKHLKREAAVAIAKTTEPVDQQMLMRVYGHLYGGDDEFRAKVVYRIGLDEAGLDLACQLAMRRPTVPMVEALHKLRIEGNNQVPDTLYSILTHTSGDTLKGIPGLGAKIVSVSLATKVAVIKGLSLGSLREATDILMAGLSASTKADATKSFDTDLALATLDIIDDRWNDHMPEAAKAAVVAIVNHGIGYARKVKERASEVLTKHR